MTEPGLTLEKDKTYKRDSRHDVKTAIRSVAFGLAGAAVMLAGWSNFGSSGTYDQERKLAILLFGFILLIYGPCMLFNLVVGIVYDTPRLILSRKSLLLKKGRSTSVVAWDSLAPFKLDGHLAADIIGKSVSENIRNNKGFLIPAGLNADMKALCLELNKHIAYAQNPDGASLQGDTSKEMTRAAAKDQAPQSIKEMRAQRLRFHLIYLGISLPTLTVAIVLAWVTLGNLIKPDVLLDIFSGCFVFICGAVNWLARATYPLPEDQPLA